MFASIVDDDAFAEEEDVLDDAKPRGVDASLPGRETDDDENDDARDDVDPALFFASTPTMTGKEEEEEQHPAIPAAATTASFLTSAALLFAEVVLLLFVELVFSFIIALYFHARKRSSNLCRCVFPKKRL